jgi:hypothetical protein
MLRPTTLWTMILPPIASTCTMMIMESLLSRFQASLLASALGSRPRPNALFEQDNNIDFSLSAWAADLNSRHSSSVVDCCILDDNRIAVVVAADSIPSEPPSEEVYMDPLDGEKYASSQLLKPRSESSRLEYCVSSSADDILLDYHDVVVTDDIYLDDHDVVLPTTIRFRPSLLMDSVLVFGRLSRLVFGRRSPPTGRP